MCRCRRKLRCVYSRVIKTTASISPPSAADRRDPFTFEETSISFSRVQRNLRSQSIRKSIYARLHEQWARKYKIAVYDQREFSYFLAFRRAAEAALLS